MRLLSCSGPLLLAVVRALPPWVILATGFCVNLRFVIFSAGWRRYFGALPRARRIALLEELKNLGVNLGPAEA